MADWRGEDEGVEGVVMGGGGGAYVLF